MNFIKSHRTHILAITLLAFALLATAAVIASRIKAPGNPRVAGVQETTSRGRIAAQIAADLAAGRKAIYADPDYGFNFWYPLGMKVGYVQDVDADQLLFQMQSDTVMEISIKPNADGVTELTPGAIAAANPGMAMADAKERVIWANNGIWFESRTDSGEPLVEFWFLDRDLIYQLTAPAEYSDFLKQVIDTWSWD